MSLSPRFSAVLVFLLLAPEVRADRRFAVGSGIGAPPLVNVYGPAGTQTFSPYGGTGYGVNVAFSDVDGNAKDDILTGPGPGKSYGPHVRAFRVDGTWIAKVNFYAYGTLQYGVNVAGADIDLPAEQEQGIRDEIVTGPGPGAVFGPHVRAFRLDPTGLQALGKVSFYAYGTLKYGVKVAGGDFDADMYDDMLTTPGPSPAFSPNVRAFTQESGQTSRLFSFTSHPFKYGGNAAGGDIDGDGRAEVVAAPGPNPTYGPRVRGFDFDNGAIAANPDIDFYAFPNLQYGAHLGLGDTDGDGYEELLVSPGPGPTLPSEVKGFDYDNFAITPNTIDFIAFSSGYGCHPAVSDSTYEFRRDFLWGTATAAHQVEGGNTQNDWYEWANIGKVPPAGNACEEWTRYDSDFAISQSLSHNAHRFSIEWSRIELAPGFRSPSAIAHYHAELASLRARGLKPLVTLHHFTNPTWVLSPQNPGSDMDGWTNPATVDAFVNFVSFCAAEYGAEVDDWITINEPLNTPFFAYILGVYPPGEFLNIADAEAATVNLINAHAKAYDAIHLFDTVDADGDGVAANVSIAHHIRYYFPKDPTSPDDVFAARHLEYLGNQLFPNAIVNGMLDIDFDELYTSPGEGYHPELANRADFLGINYYGTYVVSYVNLPPLWGFPEENPDPNVPKSECGTQIYPQGLLRLCVDFHRRYGRPFTITENGICDSDDDQRLDFTIDHLRALLRAESYGAEVDGYCHWSLVDNYEWSSGYGPKFGLVEVDFATQGRTVRPSAYGIQSVIQANTVP